MEENRLHILPQDKMAMIMRIEFCDAAKNSGIVLYARKWDASKGDYKPDFLDEKILNWVKKDYPDANCHLQSSIFDKDVEDILRFKEGLTKEEVPIYLLNLPEELNGVGERSVLDIDVYCFENTLRYPKAYILAHPTDKEEYENIRNTYLQFSRYEGTLDESHA